MPIFEYQCGSCGKIREYFSFKSKEQEPIFLICRCGADMERIMSVPAISKLADAPPANWQPLKKSKPKSYVPDPIRR